MIISFIKKMNSLLLNTVLFFVMLFNNIGYTKKEWTYANYEKTFNETIIAVAPVIAVVLLLNIFLVDVCQTMYLSFILGVIIIIGGLTIFLYGIETGWNPSANSLVI